MILIILLAFKIGGYGEVKICKSKDTGEERAVKIINKAKMTEK